MHSAFPAIYELNTMSRLTKLTKLERQIDEVFAISERLAVNLFVRAMFYLGLWTLAKHLF